VSLLTLPAVFREGVRGCGATVRRGSQTTDKS